MDKKKLKTLVVYDVIFVIDRFLNYFEGYYNPNGLLEHRVLEVIKQNFNFKFIIELIILVSPYFLMPIYDYSSSVYLLLKCYRYLRKFELDTQIASVLEYYEQFLTVYEIKMLKRNLDITQFTVSTLINLHILTCSMIFICKGRDNFEDSWMGGAGVKDDDPTDQYIIALYFVTTTLSTCGFGDLSAS